ncbi:MAG: hypothetical protein FWD32_02965, partial [Firmicutes bacterium]|nr:hypothetical protein [Bacillota bacterium]
MARRFMNLNKEDIINEFGFMLGTKSLIGTNPETNQVEGATIDLNFLLAIAENEGVEKLEEFVSTAFKTKEVTPKFMGEIVGRLKKNNEKPAKEKRTNQEVFENFKEEVIEYNSTAIKCLDIINNVGNPIVDLQFVKNKKQSKQDLTTSQSIFNIQIEKMPTPFEKDGLNVRQEQTVMLNSLVDAKTIEEVYNASLRFKSFRSTTVEPTIDIKKESSIVQDRFKLIESNIKYVTDRITPKDTALLAERLDEISLGMQTVALEMLRAEAKNIGNNLDLSIALAAKIEQTEREMLITTQNLV